MKKHYKNIIIGFGKGGKTLASWLASQGEEVAVIEKSKKMYGGTCINVACIPTKSLIVNAEKGMNFGKARKTKDKLVGALREKNYDKLANAANATVIDGVASFVSANELKVVRKGEEKTVSADRIFINTGTKARLPKIEGVDGPRVYTSTNLMNVAERPKRLVIVGGGFIGLEFADMFLKFGSREVVILDGGDRLLPKEDADVRESVLKVLEDKGLEVILGAKVEAFVDKKKRVEVTYSQGGKEKSLKADAVLMATGREAVTKKLNLEAAGIETDEKGFIVVDNQLRTTADNIWAIGDVNGGPQFTYISLDDFRIIKNQLDKSYYNSLKRRKNFATTLFTTPPYARVGMNESEAKEAGLDFDVFSLPAANIPKAAILQQKEGLLKAIVEKESGKILGCMLHCAEAHELINIVQLAMNAGVRYEVLRDQIYTHPTMAESLNDLFGA
ncbi:FAD-dependent oxidoreductase [Albibacterium indicum]|uniref:FAD-dependent oxidoreductase n=1 Tax=Albibacterium indicum TaxID=2292082 RepID=UPI000E480D9B|nr:FAD-dependent oxidoreductase [Pedobacter indicus]